MITSHVAVALALVVGHAEADEPASARAARPPLCREIRQAFKADARRREVSSEIESAASITAEDVECLRRSQLPGFVVRKAQAQLIKRHGVQALPTGPIDLWAVIPSPRAIAAGQVTVLGVLAGDALSYLGLGETVEQQTIDEILARARQSFATAGVAAEIALDAYTLPAMGGTTWDGGVERRVAVPAGVHYVLHVRIADAVAAARASKGDFVVGLGARTGMDITAMVADTVSQTVWSELAASGVLAVLVDLGEGAVP